MRSTRIDFPGANGQLLASCLDEPDGDVVAYALFAHCFTCSKDILAASRIAQVLTTQGIALFRFDFTGLGASQGEFANSNFSSNIDDLVAAADHMRGAGQLPRLLIGHSLGGAAVLAAASRIPDSLAVVTIGAPSDPSHVTGLFKSSIGAIEADGEATVQLAGRPFRIKREFLADVATQNLDERIANLRKALLVMHAPLDKTVEVANATHIFMAARHPKSFISLDDADHLLTRETDACYAANVIAAWSSRYLA